MNIGGFELVFNEMDGSGTETSWLNQAHLISTSREFATLIALDDHSAARFDTNHTGTNPAESG